MKKILFLFIVILYRPALALPPVTSGLVGCWEFSNSFNDAMGNFVMTNSVSLPTPTFDRCQVNSRAAYFSGADYMVYQYAVALSAPLGSNARSISCWLRMNQASKGIFNPLSVIHWGSSTAQGDAWQLNANYSSFGAGIDVSNQAFTSPSTCLNDSTWHHVVAVYSGSGSYSNAVIYYDGVPQNPANYTNVSGLTQLVNTLAGSNLLYLGCDLFLSRNFVGVMDDIYLYNRAITPSEIMQLYNHGCALTQVGFCKTINTVKTPSVSGATSYSWSLSNPAWSIVNANSSSSIQISANSGTSIVYVTVTTSCAVMTRSLLVTYSNTCLSIKNYNQEELDITIYPNPSKGKINIVGSFPGERIQLKLFDITGKLILKEELNSLKNLYASYSLPEIKGIYILEISNSDNKFFHTKLVLE